MITIINYGLSNLLSVERAFIHCGAKVEITDDIEKIRNATALVLPGVGAFKDGMAGLAKLDLIEIIKAKAQTGTPLLGICLGMQMLFDESDEFGTHKGLGLIKGRVEQIPNADTQGEKQRVPHIGWNSLVFANNTENTILQQTQNGSEVYFVHSFEAKPSSDENRLANVIYGGRNICAVAKNGNVTGCQFHPEKSGEIGLDMIKAFISSVD